MPLPVNTVAPPSLEGGSEGRPPSRITAKNGGQIIKERNIKIYRRLGDLGHRGDLRQQLLSVFEPQLLSLSDKKRQ